MHSRPVGALSAPTGPTPGGAASAEPGTATEKLLADVLAGVLKVESVSVDSHFFSELGADSLTMAQFCARVRKRSGLPTVSIKDVYQYPTIAALSAAVAPTASVSTGPTNPVGEELAGILGAILGIDTVPVGGHFFDDLGADSLTMAQFCARVRKRPGLPAVSMRDVYQHPTIAALSAELAPAATPQQPAFSAPPAVEVAAPPAGTLQIAFCGFFSWQSFSGTPIWRQLSRRPLSDGSPRLRGCSRPTSAPPFPAALCSLPRGTARDRKVGAHRPLEAPGDPSLESSVRPFLDG